jgi:phage tail-like protein
MAEFTVNAKRIDPYKNFKFKVKWDGKYVAGVSKVGALKKTTEVIKHREGGDPGSTRKSLGQSDWEPITLERGVTYDIEFEKWANKVWDYANSSQLGQTASLADFRKDIIIELYNVAGQKVLAYNVYRCWPSEFVAMPELDASGNAVAIQSLTLQCEGWERDTSVTEQSEPQFDLPSS